MPAIRELLTDDDLFDWDRMTGALAATEAWWVPGERHAYHSNTFGHLVGEVVHRASGRMPGDRLRASPSRSAPTCGSASPPAEQHRCADVIWAPARPIPAVTTRSTGSTGDLLMNALAHLNPPGYSSVGVVNTPPWRAAQIGSTSGHGSASGLARIYAALLEPGRLLSPDLLADATAPQSRAAARSSARRSSSASGSSPPRRAGRSAPTPGSFGHFGTGGALGFADPDAGVAFGYVMNHVIPRWQSTRNRALVDAVYASLAL